MIKTAEKELAKCKTCKFFHEEKIGKVNKYEDYNKLAYTCTKPRMSGLYGIFCMERNNISWELRA